MIFRLLPVCAFAFCSSTRVQVVKRRRRKRRSLSSLRLSSRLFQNRTEAPATEVESIDNVSLDSDSGAFGRHSPRGSHPDSPRAIVKFIRALTHHAVTVRHAPNDAHLSVTVTSR